MVLKYSVKFPYLWGFCRRFDLPEGDEAEIGGWRAKLCLLILLS